MVQRWQRTDVAGDDNVPLLLKRWYKNQLFRPTELIYNCLACLSSFAQKKCAIDLGLGSEPRVWCWKPTMTLSQSKSRKNFKLDGGILRGRDIGPRGNCPGGNCPDGYWQGAVVWGDCPWGDSPACYCLGGNLPLGDNCPGGNCLRGLLSSGAIVPGELAGGICSEGSCRGWGGDCPDMVHYDIVGLEKMLATGFFCEFSHVYKKFS